MEKVEVGHLWDNVVGVSEHDTLVIGGYCLCINKANDFIVKGKRESNISQASVGRISIMPVTLDFYENHATNPYGVPEDAQLHNVFDLQVDTVYYEVSFDSKGWIFKEYQEALVLLDILIKFKADGLTKHLTDKVSKDK